jgi:predicted kinase
MNKPILYFTVGLPGSGKSSWAEANKEKLNFVIHSSDAIRAELGDVNDQTKNELVFTTLHKRVREDLLDGKNVFYDATGLKRKNRLHFINQLKSIPCEKVCVLFATPVDICKDNNNKRERKVPEEVIDRMLKGFEVPCKQEGWDDIQIVWWNWKSEGMKFDFLNDLSEWRKISHNNKHHEFSIGDHMIAAVDHYCEMCEWSEDYNNCDDLLSMAVLMHDCGKPLTKEFIDSKGNKCDEAHFYQHHCVGSYLSLFYLKDMCDGMYMEFSDDEILYISLLVELHMYPFLRWDKSEKTKEKDKSLFGDELIEAILKIHECDLAGH